MAVARAGEKKRVLVLGGGFGGAYAAQTLDRSLPKDWDLLVVDRNNFLLFYPLLVEAGTGTIESRHVVVPIRKFMKRGEFRMAEVEAVDLAQRQVTVKVNGAELFEKIHYDQLVIALGSITKFPKIEGLKEHGFQLKSLSDGIELRDRGIRLLELANTVRDRSRRQEILRVVVVGSNFTGIEFAGEYQAFLRTAAKSYENVDPDDISVMLLEYAERILPALDADLAQFAHEHLQKRGLDIRTKTSVTKVEEHGVVLTTGQHIGAYTTVWCAGIAPNPLLSRINGLPLNQHGYIVCERNMRVEGFDHVWAVGDSATILDEAGKPYAQTAQNATREGGQVAANVVRSIRGEPTKIYHHQDQGSLAALGCKTAVAKIMGVKIAGFLAWFIYRTIYLMKMPSWSRRIRIIMDWTTDLFFRKDPVQLGIRTTSRASRDDQHVKARLL